MPVLEGKGRAEQQSSVGKLQEMLTSKPDPAAALCATAVAQVLAGQSKVKKLFPVSGATSIKSDILLKIWYDHSVLSFQYILFCIFVRNELRQKRVFYWILMSTIPTIGVIYIGFFSWHIHHRGGRSYEHLVWTNCF